MKIEVVELHPKDWEQLSEKAHLAAFNTHKPKELDRIDFALIVQNEKDIMGYLTCREHDAETIYWQFGGALPGTRDSSLTFAGYKAFVEYCRKKYKRITTLIENNNYVMLKMAMKVGFQIVGVRMFNGNVLLEHLLEFSHEI